MRVVTGVAVVSEYVVDLDFDDGSTRRVDLEPFMWGQVFEAVRRDYNVFLQVRVDAEIGTIVWPGGADIDPDVLHGDERPAQRLSSSQP